ncbi:hypothetical protein [Nocardiopsis lucentensis]|uniref:hypothetical protein n=1 Tax=Nocardiopsis lucentensis TaxID=53441 RepID=UPI00036310A5|nr:hypothetical protein [Nocardiopsis lucentensis]
MPATEASVTTVCVVAWLAPALAENPEAFQSPSMAALDTPSPRYPSSAPVAAPRPRFWA